MAVAVAAHTITNTSFDSSNITVRGTIAFGANPLTYATGGIILDFTGQDQIKSGSLPSQVLIKSAKAAAAPNTSEFVYTYLPGTTQANGKLQILTGAAAQSALAELAAGAVPAGVSGDTIIFEATFPRL